jgi:hypothetical protein
MNIGGEFLGSRGSETYLLGAKSSEKDDIETKGMVEVVFANRYYGLNQWRKLLYRAKDLVSKPKELKRGLEAELGKLVIKNEGIYSSI